MLTCANSPIRNNTKTSYTRIHSFSVFALNYAANWNSNINKSTRGDWISLSDPSYSFDHMIAHQLLVQ